MHRCSSVGSGRPIHYPISNMLLVKQRKSRIYIQIRLRKRKLNRNFNTIGIYA